MTTIRIELGRFLSETGEGNRRSMSSPFMVIDLFSRYLDEYGHEGLNEFEQSRFDKEWSEDNRFGDIFGPDHIQPSHISFFLSTFVIRKVSGTKGFRKACGPVMEKLANWLLAEGHWDEEAMRYYRDLVGDDAGDDLVACDEFTTALLEYVEAHPVDDEVADLDADDYYDDQLTIKKVETGRIVFEGLLDGDEDIVIAFPKSVTSKAKAGWSVTMEIARINGKWGILGIGNVYP
ncbi:MAG: hypothetical protein IID42_11720 [Planctomycetes bacterium]|nr:hypothetical protein [Planctomycetota bacterium]